MLASAQIHENLCKHMQMHVCLAVSRAGDTSSGPTAERRAGKSRSPHFLRAFVLCQLFKHSRAASASGNPTGAARGAQGSGCSDLRALPFFSELILLENSTCAHRGTSQKQLRVSPEDGKNTDLQGRVTDCTATHKPFHRNAKNSL